jgi:hypothetical protein
MATKDQVISAGQQIEAALDDASESNRHTGQDRERFSRAYMDFARRMSAFELNPGDHNSSPRYDPFVRGATGVVTSIRSSRSSDPSSVNAALQASDGAGRQLGAITGSSMTTRLAVAGVAAVAAGSIAYLALRRKRDA